MSVTFVTMFRVFSSIAILVSLFSVALGLDGKDPSANDAHAPVDNSQYNVNMAHLPREHLQPQLQSEYAASNVHFRQTDLGESSQTYDGYTVNTACVPHPYPGANPAYYEQPYPGLNPTFYQQGSLDLSLNLGRGGAGPCSGYENQMQSEHQAPQYQYASGSQTNFGSEYPMNFRQDSPSEFASHPNPPGDLGFQPQAGSHNLINNPVYNLEPSQYSGNVYATSDFGAHKAGLEGYGGFDTASSGSHYTNLVRQAGNMYAASSSAIQYPTSGGCLLHIRQLPTNHSVFTNLNTDAIVYPTLGDAIVFKQGEKILAHCPSFFLNIKDSEDFLLTQVSVECSNQTLVFNNNVEYVELENKDYECVHSVQPTLDVLAQSSFCNGFTQYQFGIRLHKRYKLIVLYELCADENNARTNFGKRRLSKSLQGREDFNMEETYFVTEKYDYSLRDVYNNDDLQKKHLINQLIDEELYKKLTYWVTEEGVGANHRLVPGHLAGSLEFVYRVEQSISNFFLNIQPMWENLKNNNWRNVELAVTELAAGRLSPVDVYSGTLGVQQHKNAKGKNINLCLANIGRKKFKPFQPVSTLFWKIVEDVDSQFCVAIISHNSPSDDVEKEPCIDVTKDIEWLNKYLSSKPGHGITYACSCGLNGFQPIFLPSFGHRPLLLV